MTDEKNVNSDELTDDDNQDDAGSDEPKDTKTYDEAYVKQLREEAKGYRKKLASEKAEREKLENEKLSDTEKKEKRIKELETQIAETEGTIKATKTESLITKELLGKPIVDPDTAMLLVQKELDGEEDIDSKAVAKAVERVLKAKPYLVSQEGAKPGAGNFAKTDKEPAKNTDEMFGEFLHG